MTLQSGMGGMYSRDGRDAMWPAFAGTLRQDYAWLMTALPKHKMTVDEFLAWAETHPGRYELVDGEIYMMTPQRTAHAERKYRVSKALEAGILSAGLDCHMLPDGVSVRV